MQDQPLDAKLPYPRSVLLPVLGEIQGELFYRNQWAFAAPFFRGDSSHRQFDRATILPFIQNKLIGSGAVGKVYAVRLDPKHQGNALDAKLPADLILIRKEIDLPSTIQTDGNTIDAQSAPEREGHVLSLLRLVRHPNIVRLLASYSYGDTYNLLFERAECDLGALLSRADRPSALKSDDSFYQSMQGLCSAIAYFHHLTHADYGIELKGYHHDLKPENILVNGSRFLLSDFGLSSLKEMNERSKTLSKDIVGYYLSPESENINDGFQRKLIGQPSDIWALGCILAVLLTYMLRGPEGVEQFEQSRKHKVQNWVSYTFHIAGKVNHAVDDWLKELEDGENGEASGLVSLIRDILRIDSTERPNAKTVSMRMDFLAAKSMFNSTMRIFRRIAKTFHGPVITIELERGSLYGQSMGLDTISHEWGNAAWPSGTRTNFESFQARLVSLRRNLELLELQSDENIFPKLLAKQIRGNVDKLWDDLSPVVRAKLDSMLEARIISRSDDTAVLEEVQSSFKDDLNYRNIGLAAAVKSMILLANRDEVKDSKLKLNARLVTEDGPNVTPFSSLAHLTEDSHDPGKEVLIEWLEYDQSWRKPVDRELVMRIETVAEILHDREKPDNFRALRCINYFHSISRHSFGLVFELPSFHDIKGSVGPSSQPISLASLIDETRVLQKRPALGDLFKLAESLATTVLMWHKIGWVHRSISAFSIIFFGTSPESSLESVKDPYFLGFQFSRPNEQNTFTLGPPSNPELLDYCHPDYLKENSRHLPEFDYYSLGLVLLEIAYWKKLSSFASKFKDPDQSPERLREWLLQYPVEDLHMVMGSVYQEVVKTCLSFNWHRPASTQDGLVPLDILEEFEIEVLEKLRLCNA